MERAAVVVVTVVLAATAAGAGWALGREVAHPADPSPVLAATPARTVPTATPTPTSTPSVVPPPLTAAAQRETLRAARAATVRLTPPDGSYVGSGTVVSGDGLVLTNAHVAAPQAPGLAFLYARPTTRAHPPHLLVAVPPLGDGPATTAFRASLVVADGYLDLAVLRIDATADGRPLPVGQRFTPVPIGSASGLRIGELLRVLGYPVETSGGARLTVTGGRVARFVQDPAGRVLDGPWAMDTSARITGGNSGGAAIDQAGRLVGVPSAALSEDYTIGRIRPVDLARELLDAARDGRPYDSPYVVPGTGQESARPVGWGVPGGACERLGARTLDAGAPAVAGAVRLSGMAPGVDVMLAMAVPGEVALLSTARSSWSRHGGEGCMSHTFAAAEAGHPGGFPAGPYEMRVYAGPRLQLLTTVPLQLR